MVKRLYPVSRSSNSSGGDAAIRARAASRIQSAWRKSRGTKAGRKLKTGSKTRNTNRIKSGVVYEEGVANSMSKV